MSEVIEKFLRYVAIDTESKEEQEQIPSTEKQRNLATLLAEELKEMGAENVRVSENAYVYATIPATTEKNAPSIGFISHMDTAPSFSGKNVKPQFIENYDGNDICLNKDLHISMSPEQFPDLLKYVGKTLITTDGTTLLGADDKAGVAEIMTMAQYFLSHPEIPHGTIQIGFTPDEEVGQGADLFDVDGFGADIAYTVDGGELGELEYENFNAANVKIHVNGANIHPGSAKHKMKNSILMAYEFYNLLPVFDNPMYTEGYEGFFHLDEISGDVEHTEMVCIIRDHDMEKFNEKKELIQAAADFMNKKYGENTIVLDLKDSYYNMKEKIQPHMELIDLAKETMEELGITPKVTPIRGGTDGARLSYMGLPCPNLCTGGHNFHGKYEFICVESMEKITELLIRLAQKFVS